MLCPNGHEVSPDARFCPTCGASLAEPLDHPSATEHAGLVADGDEVSPEARRLLRRPLLVVLVIAALVIAVGVAVGGGILLLASDVSQRDEDHTVTGTLVAPKCGGGYALTNASVEIRDESDTLIGSGSTGINEDFGGKCSVSFQIENVPKAEFYQFKVGTHGAPTYTYEEMQAQDWDLSLSLK